MFGWTKEAGDRYADKDARVYWSEDEVEEEVDVEMTSAPPQSPQHESDEPELVSGDEVQSTVFHMIVG